MKNRFLYKIAEKLYYSSRSVEINEFSRMSLVEIIRSIENLVKECKGFKEKMSCFVIGLKIYVNPSLFYI